MANSTDTILMIRPAVFRKNEETATDNLYQQSLEGKTNEEINLLAQEEFDRMVFLLRSHGVNVIVEQDTAETDTPDAVFPNNWISFHASGKVITYPMKAANRRVERRPEIIDKLGKKKFDVLERVDYSESENNNIILEGTGSLVLDRENKIAYASISERTNKQLVEQFCKDNNYRPVIFSSEQKVGGKLYPIYHTNVMMAIGTDVAILCKEVVRDNKEAEILRQELLNSGKAIIYITEAQCNEFAGNALEVQNKDGQQYMVMSSRAFRSFQPSQLEEISYKIPILHAPLDVIETCGGGSARCMMAEVYLPKKEKK